jgi:hypothetical protein
VRVRVRVSEVRGEAWILYTLDPSVVAPHLVAYLGSSAMNCPRNFPLCF